MVGKGFHVKWKEVLLKSQGGKTKIQLDIILMTVIIVWFLKIRIYEKNVGFCHSQWSLRLDNKGVLGISVVKKN